MSEGASVRAEREGEGEGEGDTHLLRTVIANFVLECILRAFIPPDRNGSVKGPEKVSRSYRRHSQRS